MSGEDINHGNELKQKISNKKVTYFLFTYNFFVTFEQNQKV